jgi:uncharacterized protein (DUF2267 family)
MVVYVALVEETFTRVCAVIKEEGEVLVQYEEFLSKVQDRIGPAGPDEARRTVTVTLSERINGGEAMDLAAQLPEELKEPIQRSGENVLEKKQNAFRLKNSSGGLANGRG